VANWEQEVSPDKNSAVNLETIMSDYLYRVRRWCKGLYGAYFSRHTIGEFKGVNLTSTPYRFAMPFRALDHMVAQYKEYLYHGRTIRKSEALNSEFSRIFNTALFDESKIALVS